MKADGTRHSCSKMVHATGWGAKLIDPLSYVTGWLLIDWVGEALTYPPSMNIPNSVPKSITRYRCDYDHSILPASRGARPARRASWCISLPGSSLPIVDPYKWHCSLLLLDIHCWRALVGAGPSASPLIQGELRRIPLSIWSRGNSGEYHSQYAPPSGKTLLSCRGQYPLPWTLLLPLTMLPVQVNRVMLPSRLFTWIPPRVKKTQ